MRCGRANTPSQAALKGFKKLRRRIGQIALFALLLCRGAKQILSLSRTNDALRHAQEILSICCPSLPAPRGRAALKSADKLHRLHPL